MAARALAGSIELNRLKHVLAIFAIVDCFGLFRRRDAWTDLSFNCCRFKRWNFQRLALHVIAILREPVQKQQDRNKQQPTTT
jgi:hypothetical protein